MPVLSRVQIDLFMEMRLELVWDTGWSNTRGKSHLNYLLIIMLIFSSSSMTRRSKAIIKFHPNDQKQLIDLINKARIQIGCLSVEIDEMDEKEEISTELSNMRKNRNRVKFREEDRLLQEQRKSRKLPNKRISWSKNLIEIRLVPLVITIK